MARYSKQDYKLVARIINEMYTLFEDDPNLTLVGREHFDTVMVLIMTRFITTFQEDNINFDLELFMKACGP